MSWGISHTARGEASRPEPRNQSSGNEAACQMVGLWSKKKAQKEPEGLVLERGWAADCWKKTIPPAPSPGCPSTREELLGSASAKLSWNGQCM